jgi:hypothetical protein
MAAIASSVPVITERQGQHSKGRGRGGKTKNKEKIFSKVYQLLVAK